MRVKQWVTSVAEKCYLLRGIATSEQRIDAITEHLSKQSNYDEQCRNTAESWILCGQWGYRKEDELILSDFYPTFDQVSKGLSKMDFVVMRKEELQLKIIKERSSSVNVYDTVTNVAHEPLPLPNRETKRIFTSDMLNIKRE